MPDDRTTALWLSMLTLTGELETTTCSDPRPGVKLHDILDVSISGDGTIDHVVNNTGAANGNPATVPVALVSYP